MSDVENVLLRKTSLRKVCKELNLEQLEHLANNLHDIIEERKEEEAERIAEAQEKLAKIEELRNAMLEAGISLDDLEKGFEGTAAIVAKPKTSLPPKYQIQDSDGEWHYWTGRGRAPKPFQLYLDQGGKKEDCLIPA